MHNVHGLKDSKPYASSARGYQKKPDFPPPKIRLNLGGNPNIPEVVEKFPSVERSGRIEARDGGLVV